VPSTLASALRASARLASGQPSPRKLSTPYRRADQYRISTIQHVLSDEKPVAQIWHAPLALATAGVLGGRRSAAYPALEPDLETAGAEFVDPGGVVDGLMVSARAWPDHPSWMREFERILRERAPAGERDEARPAGVA
jgi:protease I